MCFIAKRTGQVALENLKKIWGPLELNNAKGETGVWNSEGQKGSSKPRWVSRSVRPWGTADNFMLNRCSNLCCVVGVFILSSQQLDKAIRNLFLISYTFVLSGPSAWLLSNHKPAAGCAQPSFPPCEWACSHLERQRCLWKYLAHSGSWDREFPASVFQVTSLRLTLFWSNTK